MKKRIYRVIAIYIFLLGVCFNAAYADNTNYTITTETDLDNALTDTSATTKTINVNSDITLTGALASPVGTTFTINGNSKTIDGNN
jgi:hypothetical protein